MIFPSFFRLQQEATPPIALRRGPGAFSTEHQHRPRHFSRLHGAKGFVDIFEPTATGDHVIKIQSTLPVQFQILGYIEMETRPQDMDAPVPLVKWTPRRKSSWGLATERPFFIFLFTQPALFLQGRKGSEKTSPPLLL